MLIDMFIMYSIQDLSAKLKVIADPNRLKILGFLAAGEKCVCQIEDALSLNQNLVSHHLKVLRDAGLITYCKCGKWRHYSLDVEAASRLQVEFSNIITSCPSGPPKCNR
ncbi:ArsR family transcriptional regulator [Candidatus Peregrinibacteria bacterium CG22_combo_CG10-13_8_21_14_all_44_10]|nr:MAG: ArsR family transcriptional regulator [Candidatus Peregrinibacteria bacterium CG22_combo_CG10-13_8_21_14_all_44_10]PIS04487.1 MAG: ArsR family transcriptional regulator [Candidatus Peregrinibacteria bacterium CG10_big_fil_rev_8_21_14_0_10_44_7]PIX79648.1 MAG: ArsR family transcriptional regulator [Candidatus Peregrinibacteria bacterium CG_4_10_14_3_um_filter_44_21]PJB89283.1 MAG: ArsR family transcriptional regulator [Candidatus Peregrinibacteria bacterium CG_4_9_14_0_8_um_filter_44_15]